MLYVLLEAVSMAPASGTRVKSRTPTLPLSLINRCFKSYYFEIDSAVSKNTV